MKMMWPGEDISKLFDPPRASPLVEVPQVSIAPLSVAHVNEDAQAWTDGGCRANPGPGGWGVYVRTPLRVIELTGVLAHTTNNEAEYAGLIGCLEWALTQQLRTLTIYSDSEVMVRQLQGRYGCSGTLKPWYQRAGRLFLQFGETGRIDLVHVHREFNRDADRLANKAMDDAGFPRIPKPKFTNPPHRR